MDSVSGRGISSASSPTDDQQTAPSYLQLAAFLFGDRSRRLGRRSASWGIALSEYRSSNWSARYERLEDESIPGKRKRVRLKKILPRRKRREGHAQLQGGAKKAWRFRILRMRVRWVSPSLLLKRLRDAYVNMMIKLANSSFVADLAMACPAASYAISPF